MKLTQKHIDLWKDRLQFKSDTTKPYYFSMTDNFLSFCKGDLTDENIIRFLKTISENSRTTAYYVIKFFYSSAGIPLTIKISDIEKKSNLRRVREVLNNDEIKSIIKTVRLEYGTIEIAYIFLTTIYGTRRIETYNITSNDINIDNNTIIVHTAKGGQEERQHVIPAEGITIMKDFKYALSKIKNKPNITQLNIWFDNLCNKSGVDLRPRLGFHSCRRALVSELMLTDLNPTVIRNFLRWKPRGSDILLDYTIHKFDRVDNMIFEKHPFLLYWA